MQTDIFCINCNPLRVWGPSIIQSLSIILQHLSGKFREWMYCRQTRNIWPVLFQTANCDMQWLCGGTRHRCPELWAAQKRFLLHDNMQPHTLSVTELLSVHQIAEFPHVLYSPDVTLRFFSYSHDWTNTERPTLQWRMVIQTAATEQLCSIPASALQVCFKDLEKCLEAVYWWRRKLFQRKPLAPECKYTAFILIPSVSELSGHTFHTNTLLSTDINIHSNVAYTNKAFIEFPRFKTNNSKCKVSNI
jgi:hypothetical protein